jgi:poly(A) polymerase
MPVPDPTPLTPAQRKAAAELLAVVTRPLDGLARRFTQAGHDLALVGGPVRDVFLRRRPDDLDLTTDATPEQVLEITAGWADASWTVGIAFGTIGLRKGDRKLEITTYRSERYTERSRKPDVRYGTTLEGDLARRDFTVNAMAARLPSGELVDPFGGLADLRDKVLRTPGAAADSFTDDPLRILRAARFAAQLGFEPDADVRDAMTALAGRLEITTSAERIRDELIKLMLAPDPVRGIVLLVDTQVAERVLPEVPMLRLEADEHFRHKDVYQHSLTVLQQAIALEDRYGLRDDLVLRLAALLHDIGKPKTRSRLPDGRVAFHHHEVVGADMARDRLRKLRFPASVVEDVANLVFLHLRFHGYKSGEWTDSAVRRYVRDAGPLLTRLHALTRADCTTRNKGKAAALARAYDSLEARIEELREQEALDSLRPDLDGHEIMAILDVPPGRVVGQALKYLLALRIENGPLGRERATQELLRWAAAEGLTVPADEEPPAADEEPPAADEEPPAEGDESPAADEEPPADDGSGPPAGR